MGGYRGEASALEEDFVIRKKIERLLEKGKSVCYAGRGEIQRITWQWKF